MKNLLFLLLVIFLYAGCGNDNNPISPQNSNVIYSQNGVFDSLYAENNSYFVTKKYFLNYKVDTSKNYIFCYNIKSTGTNSGIAVYDTAVHLFSWYDKHFQYPLDTYIQDTVKYYVYYQSNYSKSFLQLYLPTNNAGKYIAIRDLKIYVE